MNTIVIVAVLLKTIITNIENYKVNMKDNIYLLLIQFFMLQFYLIPCSNKTRMTLFITSNIK